MFGFEYQYLSAIKMDSGFMVHQVSLVDSRFSILCKIGEGSFSNVFICLDNESSDRLLAAKIFKNDDETQL